MRKGSKTGKPAWNANPIYRDCLTCGKKFRTILAKVKSGGGKYCSKECYLKKHMENTWTEGVCLGCNKKFKYIAHRKQTCCSLSCNMKWRIKLQNLDKRKSVECLQCKKYFLVRPSKIKAGRGKYCSKFCWAKWMSENRIGERSTSWKNGKTPLYRKIRTLSNYYRWRSKVFKKDKNTCVFCGEKKKSSLIADHIKGLALIMQEENITSTSDANNCLKLWDVDNGRVLCKKCHVKTDNYGIKGWI